MDGRTVGFLLLFAAFVLLVVSIFFKDRFPAKRISSVVFIMATVSLILGMALLSN